MLTSNPNLMPPQDLPLGPNKAQQVMELMRQSPLPAKRLLEMLNHPQREAVTKLQVMARLSKDQAENLWLLLKG